MLQKYSRKEKEVIFSQNPSNHLYIIYKDFQKKMTSFSFFRYFNAFELDVNVLNFVYYGKTRLHKVCQMTAKICCVPEDESHIFGTK